MTGPERDRLLVTFGPMLPLTLVGDLLGAIGPAAERAGWTAVGINSALEIRGMEPPAGGSDPFGPVKQPCRDCGDAKADHKDGRCAGDFLHCPCNRWAGPAVDDVPDALLEAFRTGWDPDEDDEHLRNGLAAALKHLREQAADGP